MRRHNVGTWEACHPVAPNAKGAQMEVSVTLATIAWTPNTRVERNGFARFNRWIILKHNQGGQTLIAPLDKNDKPIQSERFWINTEQIAAGGLARRL